MTTYSAPKSQTTPAAMSRPGTAALLARLAVLALSAARVVVGSLFGRVTHPSSQLEVIAAHRARRAFERLGPTYVKLGQLISSSPGTFSPAVIAEFAHLRDEVPAAPFAAVDELLDTELGELRQRLCNLETTPLAAGSMSEVYAAELEDGTPVVVKVQPRHSKRC
ncbi:MAG: AarF/UbiB family protein [Acidimicrobiales bacterium]